MLKIKYLLVLITAALFTSCSVPMNNINSTLKLPNEFNNNSKTKDNLKIEESWTADLLDQRTLNIVNKSLQNNYALKQLFFDISIKKEELTASNSSLFPSMDLSFNKSRSGDFDEAATSSSNKFNLSLSYEVDIWGKLSDSQKKANVNVLIAQANYEQAKEQLIHDVLLSFYKINESSLLLEIYEKHLKNIKQNYEILESQYKQGLSTSLDTYLAQNSIFEKMQQIVSMKETKEQAIYELERLLGKYPKGKITVKGKLPSIKNYTQLGIPSSLILRKPSLISSWNELLAQNYQLAFTHKQRLPSLSLSASLEQSTASGSPLAWSLLGGLTAPLFNAGELKANEEIEKFELKKAELSYLDNVYTALTSVENLLSSQRSLKEQYEISLKTRDNSKKSSNLSMNQYLKGIETYTTVLSTQNTYYNSQISLIQIQESLIENTISLHLALGKSFIKNVQTPKETK